MRSALSRNSGSLCTRDSLGKDYAGKLVGCLFDRIANRNRAQDRSPFRRTHPQLVPILAMLERLLALADFEAVEL